MTTARTTGTGPDRHELLDLVARATLAPSPHNAQPWHWTVREDGHALELSLDPGRTLPVTDPLSREAVMACGAALLTLRVAAARAHRGVDVTVLPDPDRPEVLARAVFAEHAVDVEFAALDAVVPVRRARRGSLRAEPVPAAVRLRLAAEAHVEGARLVEVPAADRDAVARLVAAADAARGGSVAWRTEQARWVRPPWRRSGRPAPHATVLPARLAVRYLDLGGYVGAQDAALVRAAPMLAVLVTDADDRAAWLAAGEALQRVLLVAAEHGLAVGFANSACEDDEHRAALAALAGGSPQAVLRLGRRPGVLPHRPDAGRSAGRRALRRRLPVTEVVSEEGEAAAGDGLPAQRKSTSPVSTS